jgi:hypothetical protein
MLVLTGRCQCLSHPLFSLSPSFLLHFSPSVPPPPPHSLHTHTLHSRLRTLSVSCSCGVGLCCLQWAIHTLRPLIMTDMILCVYACVFRVCMCVDQCVRVRGSVREVHTQCTCVYVYMTRTCNTYTHTKITSILPHCVRGFENCHSHLR